MRDIPSDAWIHASAIRRMTADPSYRPGNLIIGGGGRGVRHAPANYGIAEWKVVHDEGDPVGECFVRVKRADEMEEAERRMREEDTKKMKEREKGGGNVNVKEHN